MRNLLIVALLTRFFINAFAADEPDRRPATALQDNSFLIEEAYNQEAGVVQHILNIRRDVNKFAGPDEKEWQLVFTQEWPLFTQTHQLSYTIPYSFLERERKSVNGMGDVLLNYRLQALYESDTRPAFAPRFSLILPTGDESKGLGNDTVGYQFNLPLSKVVSDRLTLHANAGLTLFPGINHRNPMNYNLGASAIYAVNRNLNLMLESTGEWTEEVDPRRHFARGFEAIISPGARYAFNLRAGQLVLGIGAPIGLTKAAPDFGVFFYLSFEHRFKRENRE